MATASPSALAESQAAADGRQAATTQRVRVLEAERALCEGVEPDAVTDAARAATAAVCLLTRGRWPSEPWSCERRGSLGLLVLDGMLARQVLLGEKESVDVIGPGDVLRPWAEVDREVSERIRECWIVPREARLALLDRTFALQVAAAPEIAANVADRVAMRVGWMALLSAIQGIRRIDRRLLVVLWAYAERWGRVTPGGIALDLELTHRLLGGVIGARRPSVTTALNLLSKSGALARRADGRWLLRGERPAILTALEAARPAELRGASSRKARREKGSHGRLRIAR